MTGFAPACGRRTSKPASRPNFCSAKKRHLVFILLCSAGLSLCSILPDTLLLTGDAPRASFNHWLSIGVSAITLGFTRALWRTSSPSRWRLLLASWWLLAVLTICLGNPSCPPGPISSMLTDVLIPVAICLLIPIGFLPQLFLALLLVLLDLAILLLYQPKVPARDLALVVASLRTGLVVGGMVCWQNHRSERSASP